MKFEVLQSAGETVAHPPQDASERLIASFAQALREYDGATTPKDDSANHRIDVNEELDAQISEFAAHCKANGSTPEQMLIDLKHLLVDAAPEVSNSVRYALTASATRSAIFSFFGG